MKSKKIKIIKFKSEKNLLLKVICDFNKENKILISGGSTFEFFLKHLKKKKKLISKDIILFDERITKIKKKRNFYNIYKFLIQNKILKRKNFFDFEYLKNNKDFNKIDLIKKRIICYPKPRLALIGVGNDGHIGSIFPKIEKSFKNFLISKKKGEKFKRISLNMNYIKKIKKIIIVINNKNKNDILNKILSDNQNSKMPIFKLIKASMNKVYLYYIKQSIKI